MTSLAPALPPGPPLVPSYECQPQSTVEVVCGAALALAAGVCVALAMSMQRYSLLYPAGESIPFLCWRSLPRLRVWGWGMIAYQASNGALAGATVLAPLSLCTTCFTLMLAWNVVFARQLLGERPPMTRVIGAILIVIGAAVSVFGVPAMEACNEFNVEGIALLSQHWAGRAYFFILLALVLTTSGTVLWYHCTYSILNPPERLNPATPEGKRKVLKPKRILPTPPERLDHIMSALCPISLGLQEGITQLCSRVLFQMIFNSLLIDFPGTIGSSWLWGWMALLIVFAVMTVYWLKVVYERYETTAALPFEYGAVHSAQLIAGLVFFQESHYMQRYQFTLMGAGLAIILCGAITCSVSTQKSPPRSATISSTHTDLSPKVVVSLAGSKPVGYAAGGSMAGCVEEGGTAPSNPTAEDRGLVC